MQQNKQKATSHVVKQAQTVWGGAARSVAGSPIWRSEYESSESPGDGFGFPGILFTPPEWQKPNELGEGTMDFRRDVCVNHPSRLPPMKTLEAVEDLRQTGGRSGRDPARPGKVGGGQLQS